MDLFYGDLHPDRSYERFIRQAPDGNDGCDDGAGLVQCLSVPYHVADPAVAVVSSTEKEYTVRLALEYSLYLRLSDHCRLDLLLRLKFPRLDDLDRIHDTS